MSNDEHCTSILNWGLIGAGHIALVFCNAMQFSRTGRIIAVASRSASRAGALADAYAIPKQYLDYASLLADDEIHAVYISTIHPAHAEWAIKAAEAGKHILVEKPIAMNYPEAAAMIDAAQAGDVFLMEAFMYRCHPQTRKVVELLGQGAIGSVRMIRAAFGYNAPYDPALRSYANELGGGGILDVGGYPTSMVRLIAGAAQGEPFSEPLQVKACAKVGPTGVDHYTAATVMFENDIIAEMITGVSCTVPGRVDVFGDDGILTIWEPWLPSSPCRWASTPLPPDTIFPATRLTLALHGQEPTDILVQSDRDLFTYEADAVAQNLANRQTPAMTWEDSLGNMRLLDRWREEVGVVYTQEKSFGHTTVANRTLQHRSGHNMRYGRIPGLSKAASRLVHGADRNLTVPYTSVLFDQFFELGGNFFDTSHGYASGRCEENLGAWIRDRGVRDEVIVIEKGGNPPNGTPEGIRQELLEGLDRLGMESVDIYMMHRDNPQVPVGEFVDILNELQAAGLMTVFGVSNWSLSRLKEAKGYAKANGRSYFTAVSNQFSLARILDVWWNTGGAYYHWVSASDSEFRQWFEESQMILIPWSSQASGFFLDPRRGEPDLFDLKRCWYSEDNFARRKRAVELASQYGVDPVNIALAWVLGQKFPVYPIIGTRRPDETRNSMKALDISLTDEEMRWLNLEG